MPFRRALEQNETQTAFSEFELGLLNSPFKNFLFNSEKSGQRLFLGFWYQVTQYNLPYVT